MCGGSFGSACDGAPESIREGGATQPFAALLHPRGDGLSGVGTAECATPIYFFPFPLEPPLSGRCDSAEPAAVLLSFPVLPLLSTFEAALPAFSPVFSFLAMISSLHAGIRPVDRIPD